MQFFKSLSQYLVPIMLSFVIISCTSSPSAINQNNLDKWQARQQQLSQITAFQANGSLAYFSDSSKHYGRFFISQTSNQNYQLKLTTPVGTTIFTLNVTPSLATITDSDGNIYHDHNVESLIAHLTGMKIPLTSLHQWLKGLSSNQQEDHIDNQGRLTKTQLNQNNQKWLIAIKKYMTYQQKNQSVDLPTSIELKQQNNIVRLTINHWALN